MWAALVILLMNPGHSGANVATYHLISAAASRSGRSPQTDGSLFSLASLEKCSSQRKGTLVREERRSLQEETLPSRREEERCSLLGERRRDAPLRMIERVSPLWRRDAGVERTPRRIVHEPHGSFVH